jgi:hypothetical protein
MGGPATGSLLAVGVVQTRPNCDHVGGQSPGYCDHRRPQHRSIGRSSWTPAGAGPIPGIRRLRHSASSTLGPLAEPTAGFATKPSRRSGPCDLHVDLRMRGAYPRLHLLSYSVLVMSPRGASRPQHRGRLAPSGSGAARPSGNLSPSWLLLRVVGVTQAVKLGAAFGLFGPDWMRQRAVRAVSPNLACPVSASLADQPP